MAQKLRAIFVEVLKELVREFFELFRAVKVDRVPELRPAIVQIVNRVQINILFVPAEERAPDAHVQVGLSDTGYLISLHANIEAGLDLAEVPRHALVKQRIRLVGTVNRSLVPQRFPVLRLNLESGIDTSCAFTLFFAEFLQHLTRLSYVLELIVAVLPIDILLNRRCKRKGIKVL